MDRKRQHTDSEPGQRGARRSDDYEQRENKRGRHIEHPAASLPPSLQRRLQWLDEEPQQQQQQERNGNQQQHDPRKQGGRGQRQDPRGGADRPYPQQGSRDGRSYDGRSPGGAQPNRPQQQQQQRQGQQPQQQHRDSYRPQQQQQQQQRSPRRGSDSAQREPRQREQQHAQGLDRQGSRGGVFDRLGGTSERHPGETGDQRYASRDGRDSSSRPRQGGSPGRGSRVDPAGAAAAGGERRDRRGGPDYDRSRDRLSSGAHAYRDDNAAAGASSRRSSSPRQGRHSDQGQQRQYSAERGGGRSSSPGAAGRARRQASVSEGHQSGRSADRSTPEQRHHQAAGAGDPGSGSRHQSGSRDRSRGSSHEQQQDHHHHQQQQQRAAVTPGGGAAEQPPSTGLSKKSTASKHTPIVFDLPPPPPASEGDLLPLRSSRSEDRGREPQGGSGQGAKHEQQQRSSSGVRERPQQEQGRGDDSRRRQEVRRSVSPVGRGREAARDAPPRRVPQLSPEPFKRPGAVGGDRGDSRDRRGQEVDRSRERGGGRGGGVSSSEHWRPPVQPQVEGSSRDRGPRGRSDRGQDDDWSWRPEDAQPQASQPVVKQPSVVPEAPRSSHSKPPPQQQQQQQQRVERHTDRQLPARPSLGSPRAAGQTAAAGTKPSGHGQQTEPPQQQHRERQDKPKDAPPLTPAGEQRALRKQREERRAAAVQQQLRVMHFSKALMEPQAWRELLQAVDVPEEAMDSTLATTQRMSVQASRLQSRAGAASLPLPDQAPLSSVLGNAGTEAHLHLLQESIDAYSHTAQQPWCKSLGARGSLLLGQEFAGLLW